MLQWDSLVKATLRMMLDYDADLFKPVSYKLPVTESNNLSTSIVT